MLDDFDDILKFLQGKDDKFKSSIDYSNKYPEFEILFEYFFETLL